MPKPLSLHSFASSNTSFKRHMRLNKFRLSEPSKSQTFFNTEALGSSPKMSLEASSSDPPDGGALTTSFGSCVNAFMSPSSACNHSSPLVKIPTISVTSFTSSFFAVNSSFPFPSNGVRLAIPSPNSLVFAGFIASGAMIHAFGSSDVVVFVAQCKTIFSTPSPSLPSTSSFFASENVTETHTSPLPFSLMNSLDSISIR